LDETYQTYLNRVARLTRPASYQAQLQNIQRSPKFKRDETGTIQAVSFPGYSVVTPPWEEEPENSAFYKRLERCQQQLIEPLDKGLFVTVPPESFHLTLADLIWDSAYRDVQTKNPEFEPQLRSVIAQSFQQYNQKTSEGKPILWQLLGFMIRPRAIAVCLIPQDEDSYQRILKLRRAIYQNTSLIALGVEQQYHFTAHITLGYFGDVSAEEVNRDRLSNILSDLSMQWLEADEPSLLITRAELRKFDDMTRYYRQPEWPAIQL
jgi:hypothetical protein